MPLPGVRADAESVAQVTAMDETESACTPASGCWYEGKGFTACHDITDGRCLMTYTDHRHPKTPEQAAAPILIEWNCPCCGRSFHTPAPVRVMACYGCGASMRRVETQPEPPVVTYFGAQPDDGRAGDMWQDNQGNTHYCSAAGEWISVSDISIHFASGFESMHAGIAQVQRLLDDFCARAVTTAQDFEDIRDFYAPCEAVEAAILPRYAGCITNDPWYTNDSSTADDLSTTSNETATNDLR